MKGLSIVLSIYIALLSWLPCSDEAIVVDSSQPVATFTSDTQRSDEHPPIDLCSPLCICSCCGGFVLTSLPINTFQTLAKPIIRPVFYTLAPYCQPSFGFWQPPKA